MINRLKVIKYVSQHYFKSVFDSSLNPSLKDKLYFDLQQHWLYSIHAVISFTKFLSGAVLSMPSQTLGHHKFKSGWYKTGINVSWRISLPKLQY